MKESIITGALAVCSLVMMIVAGAGIFVSDRTAPVISLDEENDLIYTEGDPEEILLENVTAEDDKDGDVTESLRISKIHITSEDDALVTYVAKDKANNIGKLKRKVHYVKNQENVSVPEDEDAQENEGANSNTPVPESPTGRTANQGEALNGPRITMVQNEATLKVGDVFNILRYVQSAVDTDGTSLSRSVHVDGLVDMSRPGVYSINVYATNANGVSSNVETFTLTVEP